jgi:hypothetical protein
MPDFGPTRADGGSPFEDMAPPGTRIAGLFINHGGSRNIIIGIQLIYVNTTNGGLTFGEQHGGVEGTQARIGLQAGEFFTQISGRFGRFVDSLTIETSGGPNGPQRYPSEGRFGGLGGTEDYEFPEVNGQEIIGFLGKSGTLIDAIGVRTR